MAKAMKAAADERKAYQGVYPLYGHIMVDGHRCVVEDLRGGGSDDDPKYEIMAPSGKHFEGEGTHSLLCFSISDLCDRANAASLEDCTEACGPIAACRREG